MEFGNLLPYVNSAGAAAFVGLAVRAWFQSRKLDMAEKIQDRQGYGPLIRAMQAQLKSQGEEIVKLRLDLGNCESEHLKSRTEVAELRLEVKGLRAQLTAHAEIAAVALGASPIVQDAGHRAARIIGDRT